MRIKNVSPRVVGTAEWSGCSSFLRKPKAESTFSIWKENSGSIQLMRVWVCPVVSGALQVGLNVFFAGAQGCGRLGDSFLWEGSMFVFQFVGGDGRGHILAQGPQLKISSFGKEKEELKK